MNRTNWLQALYILAAMSGLFVLYVMRMNSGGGF